MRYKKQSTSQLSFPLGGIGSGCIGLGGDGSLKEWEIFNRPAKNQQNGYSHFAVRAVNASGECSARMLVGDSSDSLTGRGDGLQSFTQGFPHFNRLTFDGNFPMASLDFQGEQFPGTVRMRAFNPFLPLNDRDSSLPAAFFTLEFRNTSKETIDYTAAFTICNPFENGENATVDCGNGSAVQMKNAGISLDDPAYGDLTIAAQAEETGFQEYWYRGMWQDGIVTFWREFSSGRPLPERHYTDTAPKQHATVYGTVRVKPKQKKTMRFIVTWNMPNCYNYWRPYQDANGKDATWKNYYATQFRDSAETAAYSLCHWDRLFSGTECFCKTLYGSTMDPVILEAAGANLAVLKSPTVLRLEDGSFYGWEGVWPTEGSCEGSCTHVWNYAYALSFLFPQLERSLRESDYRYNQNSQGGMRFRIPLPPNRTDLDEELAHTMPCVDGTMGGILKVYREWKLGAGEEWLAQIWPAAKRSLDFACHPESPVRWDADKDGVLEGRQHHTLDMELYGPSGWLEGFYLAALKAAAEIESHLKHPEEAQRYQELFRMGSTWTEEHLFNGKWYIQQLDLGDKKTLEAFHTTDTYWNEEAGEIKYQIGEGCEIDQMCAQWHANILGLGTIFEEEHRHTALQSLYQNNVLKSFRDFPNPWRLFAVNGESGAIICSFPDGVRKPCIPIPYCEESMHGFEYQLAGLLMSEGFFEEGLRIVKAVRARYNGENRNPWNEIECGNHYARSMASYALIPICSGFVFDLPHRLIGWKPLQAGELFRSIWSVEGAWGEVSISKEGMSIQIFAGALTANRFLLPNGDKAK